MQLAIVFGAAALSLSLTSTAAASAVVSRGSVSTPILEVGLPDDCRPGLTGSLEATDLVTYQSVETSQGFHVVLTVVDSGQIEWSDGTYSVIDAVGHVSFIDTLAGTSVSTVAHRDSVTTYAADGTYLTRATFQIVERLTVTNGEVQVEFERGHLHFFGGC
jgi:hypothetical protein